MADTPWHRAPLAILDFETTGLDANAGDRVVEVGVVLFDQGEVTERWGALVDPQMPLPADTTRITGIEQSDLEGAPAFEDVADELLRLLKDRILVAYNAAFDREFLVHELSLCGRALPGGSQWLDPLVFAKELQKGQGKMKLGIVAKRLGVPLEEAHRAVSDAECAGHVLLAMAPALPADQEELFDLHERWLAKQRKTRMVWRGKRGGRTAPPWSGDSLGPGYPNSEELDPIRYMFLRGTGRV